MHSTNASYGRLFSQNPAGSKRRHPPTLVETCRRKNARMNTCPHSVVSQLPIHLIHQNVGIHILSHLPQCPQVGFRSGSPGRIVGAREYHERRLAITCLRHAIRIQSPICLRVPIHKTHLRPQAPRQLSKRRIRGSFTHHIGTRLQEGQDGGQVAARGTRRYLNLVLREPKPPRKCPMKGPPRTQIERCGIISSGVNRRQAPFPPAGALEAACPHIVSGGSTSPGLRQEPRVLEGFKMHNPPEARKAFFNVGWLEPVGPA